MRFKTYWLLTGTLLLGAIVRLLGPIRDMALGQTDAYAHLQFLRDWVEMGRLRHPGYPPGYYWVIGLPTRLLALDPYYVIRFGGVFFGLALIYGVYLLGRRCFSEKAALWAAFLVSAFPAFWLLQKTGVGAYPSPLGLVLTVLLLLSWDKALGGLWRWFCVFLCGVVLLAMSVPIMLIDVLFLLLIDCAVRAWRRELPFKRWLCGVALCAFVCAGMISVGFLLVGPVLEGTLRSVAGLSSHPSAGVGFLWQMLLAYVSPERGLPQPWWVSGGALVVLFVLVLHAFVLWQTNSAVRMLIIWSLLAWAQAVFGVFQFPLYIRAGWHLLIAIALLGGWLIATVLDVLGLRLARAGAVLLISAALVTILFPRVPTPHLSPAENDLVRVLRDLAAWADGNARGTIPELQDVLETEDTIVLWSRSFNSFPGHQGDPVWAFLEAKSQIQLMSLDAELASGMVFAHDKVHLALLDDNILAPSRLSVMEMVNPALTASLQAYLEASRTISKKLRVAMEDAAECEHRTLTKLSLKEGLDVYILSQNARE